jgi:hypothetical protein
MEECILFDKNGKEIDWFDPIDDVIECDFGTLEINHQNGTTYIVDGKDYSTYIVRETGGD